MSWLDGSFIEQLGWTLLHFLWQGALIGLAYAATLPATRRAAARTRYGIAVITLAALAAAPTLTLAALLHAAQAGTAALAATDATVSFSYLQMTVNAEAGGISIMQAVVAAWLAGVAVLSSRLILGWHFLRKLRRSADFTAARSLQPLLETLLVRLQIRRRVALALSSSIRSPVVIGWFRPLVLLPPAIVTGLPPRQIEMVLAHELAHVRRLDPVVNLGQVVVETVLFYHPVVRWVSRRIRIERENACDDLAVGVTRDRLAYVEMLASLERLRYRGPRLALAMHDGQMLGRIRRLVERGRPDRQQGLIGPAVLSGLIVAAAGGLQLVRTHPASPEPAPVAAQQPDTRSETAVPGNVDRRDAPELDADAGSALSTTRPRNTRPVEDTAIPRPDDPVRATTAGSVSTAAEETPRADFEPPDLPTMETRRLPPVAELIERPVDRRLAVAETPSLALASLPQPHRQPSPKPGAQTLRGGELIERIEPAYPEVARQKGLDGRVEVAFLVTRDGQVRDIDVVDETPRGLAFAEAAREAITDWRFEPFRKGDKAIERRVQLEVAFDLGDKEHRECRSVIGSRIPRCY